MNHLNLNESFDLILFNSTKGERWYRFVFSIPDFELRQGKVYPNSLDLLVDYDKWIKNSYFGIGNDSKFEDREFYTREPLEISLTASRGFTEIFVGQFGTRYKSTRNYNFAESSDPDNLANLSPELNPSVAEHLSFFLNLRYDTRNSFINPSRGIVIHAASCVRWAMPRAREKPDLYTLVELYEVSRLHLYHFDFYRFHDPKEWIDAGFRDTFNGRNVCLIEWPERAQGQLPPADLDISLAVTEPGRSAKLTASSPAGERLLAALQPG